jgi:AcrR family transcriptional regulator
MFARKGIKSTTVREIADAVGVLSGSLYHYFDSKDAIVAEILKGFLDVIRARYGEVLAKDRDAVQSLRGLVSASLLLAREQPDATAIYQNELQYLRDTPRFSEVQAACGQGMAMVIERLSLPAGTFTSRCRRRTPEDKPARRNLGYLPAVLEAECAS